MKRATITLALARVGLRAHARGPAALHGRRSDDSADAGGDGEGPGHVAPAGRAVPGPAGDLRGPAERGARRQPERARGSRRARSRARAGQAARARSTAFPVALKDNIHTTDMPTTGGALAFAGYVPPYEATLTKNLTAAGRHHHRQDRADRAGQLGRRQSQRHAGQLQRGRRLRLQSRTIRGPIRGRARRRPAGAADRRLEFGHRHRRQLVGRQRRLRHRRLDHQPVERQHAGRHPADHRPHQPLRRDSDYRRSRHRRPDDADGGRRGDHARRDGRRGARSQRCGDPDVHAAARARLHEVPERRRPQGRAHRHAARVLHRPRDAARRERAARRPQPRAGQGDGRGDRRPEAAGRDRRRSRRRAKLRGDQRQRQLSAVGLLLRRRTRQGQGQPTARSSSSTA